jgi:3-methyladenine DNA glycosylase AlkD
VGQIRELAKSLGRDHALALGLWETGWYEARMLACFVADPKQLTAAEMDRWCRDFDNWAICDTACFHVFDRSPLAWRKLKVWAKRKPEFQRRTAFALIASVALHDKKAEDQRFLDCLPLIELAATDERNFVKKGVSWALRGIGRRNVALHAAASAVARRLAAAQSTAARWIGKDALRDLARARPRRA